MRTTSATHGSVALEARTLAVACLVAGVVALGTAVVPYSDTAPVWVAAISGVLGLVVAALLALAGADTPRWALHGTVGLASVVVSGCVAMATTDPGRVLTAYGYVWVALYTAWFHRRRAMAAHLAGIAGGLAVALVAGGAPAPAQTWGFVVASVVGVAVVLNTLVGRLRRLADHDQLTGLLNRAAFVAVAERAMAQAERSTEPLTVALLDLDGFKEVNDRRGHAAGDELLVDLARAWTSAVRRGDVLARYGGDEFVLLMPATTRAAAELVLPRMADADGAGRWSAGLAEWRGEPLAEWLRRADAELYERKRTAYQR